MEYETTALESDNINALWMKNVFESLKNLEIMERNAREGCASLFEYLQIPIEYRNVILADAQYKNLRFMVTEFSLLLMKLRPVLQEEEMKLLTKTSKKLIELMERKKFFVKEFKRNNMMISQVTPVFNEFLNLLSDNISEIIKKIEHLLYISQEEKPRW